VLSHVYLFLVVGFSVDFVVLTDVSGDDSALELLGFDNSAWKSVFGDDDWFSISDVRDSELLLRHVYRVVLLVDMLGR